MEILLPTLLIVALSVALLAVRLFFGRGFVATHVGQSRAMRRRGIHCVQSQDAAARKPNPKKVNERHHEK